MLPKDFSLGPMRADEARTLGEWAGREGWNPGIADIDVAWNFDPGAFVALRQGGELAAGGSCIAYGGRYGFMGLYIVRPDLRGEELGRALGLHLLLHMQARLAPGAPIGMDGVYAMVPFYERNGFSLAHRDLRYEGPARGDPDPRVVALDRVDFAALDRYDRLHVAAPRPEFLQAWISQPGVFGVALEEPEGITGYGVARPCRKGWKLGPVFATDAARAQRIVGSLLHPIDGDFVQIDVPEPNAPGIALAAAFGLTEAFGCARMYLGAAPALPLARIFGLTSFEFG